MRLGTKSERKIEEFFREDLADPGFRMPEVHFYAGRFAGFVARLFVVEGITIGRRVIIFPDRIRRSERGLAMLDEELAVHEIVHVLQYRREGFLRFLWRYLAFYRANLKRIGSSNERLRALAYFEIPYEIEARETASRFVEWSGRRRERS